MIYIASAGNFGYKTDIRVLCQFFKFKQFKAMIQLFPLFPCLQSRFDCTVEINYMLWRLQSIVNSLRPQRVRLQWLDNSPFIPSDKLTMIEENRYAACIEDVNRTRRTMGRELRRRGFDSPSVDRKPPPICSPVKVNSELNGCKVEVPPLGWTLPTYWDPPSLHPAPLESTQPSRPG